MFYQHFKNTYKICLSTSMHSHSMQMKHHWTFSHNNVIMSLSWMINQLMLKICHHHFILLYVFFAQWLLIGCDFQGLSSYWLWHFSWPGKKVLGLPRPVKQGQPRCPWKSLDDKMSSNVLEVFTECASWTRRRTDVGEKSVVEEALSGKLKTHGIIALN